MQIYNRKFWSQYIIFAKIENYEVLEAIMNIHQELHLRHAETLQNIYNN